MPPKGNKKNDINRQEMADKIREVKARQQSWLRPGSEKADVSLDTSELRRVNSKPVSTGGTLEGKTNSGYDAWLNRRKNLSDHGNSDSSSECGTDSTAICLSSRSDLSGLNDDNSLYHCPGREKLTENKTNQKMKTEYFSDSVQQSNVQSSSQLSSHFCSVCSNLMLGVQFQPLLIIPCGHTVCNTCASVEDRCPVCNCVIHNRTFNVMLHQIVKQYHSQNNRSEDFEIDPVCNTHEYSEGKKKSEEYKNMKLRCEVLEVGKEELLSKIDEIKKQQRGEEKRIDNINREQDRIRKDIEEMQKRLQMLDNHKAEYENKCQLLEDQQMDERKKINLLETTLSQLHAQMEEMKSSVKNLETS